MAAILEFGPFRLDADAGILFRGAEPTPLGQRAVLLLALLVQRAGMPVSKDALIEAAWPAQAIEDSNLTVQIAAVRRTLADASGEAQWIETLPRRGYRYIGPAVTTTDPDRASAPSLALPERPSIAVLPFANLSGDAEQDYFADGMVDDIITGLSRINWLFVIARNSTFTYKGRAIDVKQVGRELGVRYVLEGSIRKAGGNVRITGQLIDASTGMHVWAERYDRRSEDIFALQDEIAMSVVGAIAPSLRRAEINRVKRKRPDSLDAYDLVLRAQPDVDSGMPEQVTQALVLLERAIALEPSYALAHGNAAMCHHCLFLRAGLREVSRAASIRHARSAIAHGQDDALALTLAGFSIGMDGHDRAAAFTALDAALSISPSSALTYILGSVMLGWGGDADRAIEWSERGMRLSPFDSWAFAAFDAQAMGHFHRGRYEEACRAAYRSVQANPRHSITHVQLAAALAKLGRLQEAKAAAARVMELHPTFRYGRQFQGVNCSPALAAELGDALRVAGLPE
ncbi:winged helix-turn-helix domain-containing protein [Bradyrhizobium manausense]|uniref:winged helix-turn-helix domain-containing protein n=1 Tax=Bradyrhizobium manausense TaxID=989370 RepID=UPI001BA4563B|nr:winged helix-turn-helix domain-containing protein [Bradyrhizobium manausense]MBR0688330.1 winged helix-turn-helix domain-containing protein [Bradyrhizobium manausense]MBR0721012.1 winged helix-turn-helix domain-containing protein [Bradyrhizobium manausense]